MVPSNFRRNPDGSPGKRNMRSQITQRCCKKGNFEEKTIVYTLHQTKGRGRQDKKWVDFKNKNLALSFIINPLNNFTNDIWQTATAALALINLLKKLKIKNYWIKWPNDIYINNKRLSAMTAIPAIKP